MRENPTWPRITRSQDSFYERNPWTLFLLIAATIPYAIVPENFVF